MKKLFFAFACLIPTLIFAQTIKTDVLILGNADAAYSSGLQVSRSSASVVILTQSNPFSLDKIKETKSAEIYKIYENVQLRGIAYIKDLEKKSTQTKKKNTGKDKVDGIKLFKIINDTPIVAIERSGSGWEAKISKSKSIKAKVLVVADNNDKLLSNLNITNLKPVRLSALNYTENLYRTTISGITGTPNFLSLYHLLIPDQENLLYINPNSIEIGQAAGATSAYAAFFKTKTSLSNLKAIQGELLTYKLPLMPFVDVKVADSNWLAIQKIGITGILKAEIKNERAFFNPEKEVTNEEIKQPIKDYYYKAQIWFDDHKDVPINLENTILLVSYVGNKAVEATKTELQKKWNSSYKFPSKYDLKRVLTRREFSVIINEYLKPFDQVNVDKTGRVIR
ncbi:hypothetical protein EV200_103278 [Pedobacter psychrotolerans]|uniref:Uncharacterized protein n=1 Tax=Pedobacter psychrotolerans TaxID=1843235 RepID=A0A4R2HH69_9SPHI|nr:hypothetical protein [Pedobacter psychrotolerans]TCO26946.1 hypothetical protein EV200_103278 [Pedobacter psychrotolerans]GGE57769.1 hypothetical protein GCM10011413_25200 [Pedobacter psychrotolerans]